MMQNNDDLALKADIGRFAILLNNAANTFAQVNGFNRFVGVNQAPDAYTMSLSSLLQYATAYAYRFSKMDATQMNSVVSNMLAMVIQNHDRYASLVGSQTIQQKLDVLNLVEKSGYMLYTEPYSYNVSWIAADGCNSVEKTMYSIKYTCCACGYDYCSLPGFNQLPEELKKVLAADRMQSAILSFYAV